jgi:hypothetical protein
MKKILSLLLVLILCVSLAACGGADSDNQGNNDGQNISSDNTASFEEPKGKKLDALPDNIPEKFVLTTTSGIWKTEITLKKDGTFTGNYTEKVPEYSEEFGYPNGKIMLCDFDGKFKQFIKVDQYTIAMKLDTVTARLATEEMWLENGIWYETTAPVGIEYGEWFYIYLPGRPTADLDKNFTMWYINSDVLPSTLDVYGLFNQSQRYGFFG